MFSKEQKLNLLLGLFVAALIGANLLGTKIADFVFFQASVGILFVPILFLVTDIIEEVYGKEKTKQFVITGVIALIFMFALTTLAVVLNPVERFENNEAFVIIFGSSLRIMVASIIAFVLAQFHDIWAFNFWKEKTGGKYLWLRNNLSTIVSQFIDTTLFMFIAFYMITPKFDFWFIWALIIPYYLLKVLFAFFDTPLVYLGVTWLRGGKKD